MGRIVLVILVAAACVQPSVTECPTVDCPGEMVCDGQGGCVVPEQLAECRGLADGESCSYTNLAKVGIDGTCASGVCRAIGCGNGVLTSNEACDDGNAINGDGCSADCQSNETCGNSVIDAQTGEQCDDGNNVDGDGCQAACKLPSCGDGIMDSSLNEQCDAGAANSMAPDAACRPNCQLPRCGDMVLDVGAGEKCDDGDNQSSDGCSGDCLSDETCGNGVTDVLAGEKCDDGNNEDNDGCSADCLSTEVCGDNVINSGIGELCDDGGQVSGDGCSADCQSLETCGNNIVDTFNEQCDEGGANSNAPDSDCRTNCRLPVCGDDITDPLQGEACDDGMMNANAPNACRLNCQLPRCGDNIIDTGEVCDDGDTVSGNGCSADCLSLETCGNGIIDIAKGETCDAAGLNSNSPNAPCRADCKLPRCGDGIRDNTTLGEGCDAGMMNSNAPNAMCRPNCQLPRCGDNVIDNATPLLEVCDDNNTTSGDGCSADCRSTEMCGNGIIDVAKGEQCDAAGNNANTANAPCRLDCKLPRCGDGIRDDITLGEGCDAGMANSNNANAACRPNCQPRRCGDGIPDTTFEVCDDGGTVAGDGCSPDCSSNETCGNGIVDFVRGEQCDDNNVRSRDGCSSCRPEAAIVLTPNSTPNQRDSHLFAYDGARRKVVMYGGWTNDGNLADTWEWDGASWTQIRTAHSPGPRLDAAYAYDPKRKRIVLFGGFSANYTNYRGDTWEYDGVDWVQRTPATSPPPLAAAAMAFDGTSGNVILYGGLSNDALQPTATWSWNGTTWTRLTPAANPGVREGHRMTWSSVDNYIVMFGGSLDSRTWTWANGAWTDRGASTVANFNYSTALAYDANKQKVVLWDGTQDVTWEWTGGTTNAWASIAGTTPPARGYIAAAYDAARKQIVLFGGYQSNNFDDTWVRDAVGWSEPAVATPWQEPSARSNAGAAYDPMRKRVVMFGGRVEGGPDSAETWEWDGRKWQLMAPTTPPSARDNTRLVYNATARQIMLFGGESLADMYTYSGTAWAPAAMSGGRTALRGTALTWDTGGTGRLVNFAGNDNATFNPVDTTWTWTATSGWQTVTATTKPPARKGHAIVYDPVRQRTVLFGGVDDQQNALGEVWELAGSTWSEISATVGPQARSGGALVYNPDAQRVVSFGNGGGLSGEDMWEWNGAGWNQRPILGTVPQRYRASIAFDSANHALVTFGGRDGNFGDGQQGTHLLAYWPNNSVEACTQSTLDYDNDGLAGCADPDCWAQCTPLCPPGTSCTGLPRCGDSSCSANEDCAICPGDCGACTGGTCGDFHCGTGETAVSCPNDC